MPNTCGHPPVFSLSPPLAMSAAPAGAAKKSQLKFFSSNVSTSVTDGTRPSTEGVSGPIHSAKRRSLGATGRDQDWQL